jgi:dTMP kinase
MTRGKYIVIEGHDGTGKSLQVELLEKRLQQQGIQTVQIHEPAGVPIADELRKIIKNGDLQRDGTTNLLLFTATRRELYLQTIAPSIEKGVWVLAARSWLSTVAYQGYGEGLDIEKIHAITSEFTDPQYLSPDFACVLSLENDEIRAKRIEQRGELENPDTFESRGDDFQNKVKQGYIDVANEHNLPIIDASPSADQVSDEIWRQIAGLTD